MIQSRFRDCAIHKQKRVVFLALLIAFSLGSGTTTMMKSVFIIFATLIVAMHANDTTDLEGEGEWNNIEKSCKLSPACQEEVKVYKACPRLNGLNRESPYGSMGGPCIECSDGSMCCCDDMNRNANDFQGDCQISQGCELEIDAYNEYCQEEDRNHMAEASLGCADGSRCWCFEGAPSSK